ncbi:hypothetical protein M9Y10_029595 [Tritrichomonas musculus]|uniref:RRM domain-containing protein n=1 Tax=Tritrichomonas musculus TaxID=1915356 RepID=A0ABR2KMP9_9EUKA
MFNKTTFQNDENNNMNDNKALTIDVKCCTSSKWSDFLETPPPNAYFDSDRFIYDSSSCNLLEFTPVGYAPSQLDRPISILPSSEGTYVKIPDNFQPDSFNFEFNFKELPSRSLQLANIPENATEEDLDYIFSFFGEVEKKNYSRLSDGVATVQFYSMEDSQRMRLSLISIRNRIVTLIFRPEDLNETDPVAAKQHPENNGTIVLFHLPKNTTDEDLKQLFEQYGRIRQIRHTPYKDTQRFIEYYDTRSAAKALEELNGKLLDKRNPRSKVAIEFSLPGVFKKNIQKYYRSYLPTVKRNTVSNRY